MVLQHSFYYSVLQRLTDCALKNPNCSAHEQSRAICLPASQRAAKLIYEILFSVSLGRKNKISQSQGVETFGVCCC